MKTVSIWLTGGNNYKDHSFASIQRKSSLRNNDSTLTIHYQAAKGNYNTKYLKTNDDSVHRLFFMRPNNKTPYTYLGSVGYSALHNATDNIYSLEIKKDVNTGYLMETINGLPFKKSAIYYFGFTDFFGSYVHGITLLVT